jgi:sporadic carbohydrate cluster protein (TIGR04323 family)
MSNRFGYRGYIASRPVRGMMQPQNVQNLVVRDYAQRNGLSYKLSATEYAMPGSYMILESVLEELPSLEGVIFYSLFMLPEKTDRRREVYRRILDAGCALHGALENMVVDGDTGIDKAEDMFMIERLATTAAPAGD